MSAASARDFATIKNVVALVVAAAVVTPLRRQDCARAPFELCRPRLAAGATAQV